VKCVGGKKLAPGLALDKEAEAKLKYEREHEPKDTNAGKLALRLGSKARNQKIRHDHDATNEQHSADELSGRIAKPREENCFPKGTVQHGEQEDR
jgi:hypothetical protein